jgi:hypothetical protein
MRESIARYHRKAMGPHDDPEIGCLFVRDVTFFPDDMAYDPPPGFAPSIVQGKTYDMADHRVSGYFGDLMQLMLGKAIRIDFSQPWHVPGPVFGDPRLTPYRLAQRAFKAVVLSAYHGHCASRCRVVCRRPGLAVIRNLSRRIAPQIVTQLLVRASCASLWFEPQFARRGLRSKRS